VERAVDIATDGRHLSLHRGFLIVSEERVEVGRVPLDDIAAVIVHAHGVTWSTNLMVALSERGAPVWIRIAAQRSGSSGNRNTVEFTGISRIAAQRSKSSGNITRPDVRLRPG
jgi:hypothetical protein